MVDLARIKSNVAKMAAQNAPEADIDGYIASEGTTVDEIRAFKPQPTALDSALTDASANTNQFWQKRGIQPAENNLATSTASTLSGIVNSIPVIGPMAQDISDRAIAGVGALQGNDYGQGLEALKRRRQELSQGAPIANLAGNVAGAVGTFGAGMGTKLGAEALGATGPLMQQVVNSALSTKGLEVADNLVRGKRGMDAVGGVGNMALAGAAPVAGNLIGKAGEKIADAVTGARQNALTNTAIKGADSAADIKSAASKMFDASTGGTPLAITDNAYFRFLGGVKEQADKLRVNEFNDPQAVGLLQYLMNIADDTSKGVVVDLKDLHLARQLARDVAKSKSGREASLGATVIKELDSLISTLKPTDILGGADPKEAANALMQGISTWSRASKVGMIEEAITKAGTYKSGLENGLRLQFQSLIRNPDTRRLFNKAEIQAITDVANGTTKTNLVTLLGKFGFGAGSAGNMTGGTIGATLGGTLGSALGPLGTAAGIGLAGGGGMAMRALSERMGSNAANRAAQVVATQNIPTAVRASNPLISAAAPIELLIRGGAAQAQGR